MAKKIVAVVKIQLEAGGATPARRSHGPRATRHPDDGVLQAVQRRDESMKGKVIPVDITIYDDRSFSFILKTHRRRCCCARPPGWQGRRTSRAVKSWPRDDDQIEEIAKTN